MCTTFNKSNNIHSTPTNTQTYNTSIMYFATGVRFKADVRNDTKSPQWPLFHRFSPWLGPGQSTQSSYLKNVFYSWKIPMTVPVKGNNPPYNSISLSLLACLSISLMRKCLNYQLRCHSVTVQQVMKLEGIKYLKLLATLYSQSFRPHNLGCTKHTMHLCSLYKKMLNSAWLANLSVNQTKKAVRLFAVMTLLFMYKTLWLYTFILFDLIKRGLSVVNVW